MPTFSEPSVFYELRRMAPADNLTVSDLCGILADHVRSFLDAPAAYAGVSVAAVGRLMSSLEVHTDPERLMADGRESWVFVAPGASPVQAEPQSFAAGIATGAHSGLAPQPLFRPRMELTAAGALADSGMAIMTRTLLVAVSSGTRAGTLRAADAVYTWLSDMLDILQLDFGCRHVSVSPVQVPGEAEKPLFAGVAANPAVMQVTVVSVRTTSRRAPRPV